MRRWKDFQAWLVLGLLALLLAGGAEARRYVHAHRFLAELAAPRASTEGVLQETELSIPSGPRPIRARVYRPASGKPAPGVVVAHGVHYRGIDEARLVPFARALASAGYVVLTPELTELADYRLTRDSVDRIRDAVWFLSSQRQWVNEPRIGLIGFSFAGGLSLVAASESALADRLQYVVSVGGHHELQRVLSFLLTNQIDTPTGVVSMRAHDYGLAVVLYGNLERFVPREELREAEAVFRAWLHEDRKSAGELAAGLLEGSASARLFGLLQAGQLQTLKSELTSWLEHDRARLAELSPHGKLDRVRAPVYLLHGAHDSVIPPSEASFAALELGRAEHRALISPWIDHVEVGKNPSWADQLELVAFMARLF